MISNLDNNTIISILLISSIIPIILAYEDQSNSKKNKRLSIKYYFQWFIISLIINLFSIITVSDKNKVENNILVGPPTF